MQDINKAKAKEFLSEASQFRLGDLPTEARHPRTANLSEQAITAPKEAIALLIDVELEAVKVLGEHGQALAVLTEEIRTTLNAGGRIFLCGCGATGRLSVSLETIWREEVLSRGRKELSESVISFIAGGDYAMVRSIENFEDHPEYGARQLHDLGFTENDILIACTEGGETPFVIGAAEEAAKISKRSTFFLFCNPPELLAKMLDRSRRVFENPRIRSTAFLTGPMALTGSTRLQATSALMLATGAAMYSALGDGTAIDIIEKYLQDLKTVDMSSLSPIVCREAEIYAAKEFCLHRTSKYGITVLTDTTERSPTFSLLPFENDQETERRMSWTYLILPETRNAHEAWRKVFGRDPRPLEWPELSSLYGHRTLLGFDFSRIGQIRREEEIGNARLHTFDIEPTGENITMTLDGIKAQFKRPKCLLNEHLLLKCALNISSTLAMGRIGRFQNNVMLYVRATNKKLIDRSIRYVQGLLTEAGITTFSYDQICYALFETMAPLAADEPAVLRTFEALRRGSRPSSMGIAFAIFFLIFSASSSAHAWGKRGHALICQTAAYLASSEPKAGFLKERSFDLEYYCNVPDLVWKRPATYKLEADNHFMDMEIFAREFKDSKVEHPFELDRLAFNAAFPQIPEHAGRAFWRIRELNDEWEKITILLTKPSDESKNPDMSSGATDEQKQKQADWLVHAGVIGHYVGDLSQPLHVTENYDGQLTDQKGIHSFFEDEMVNILAHDGNGNLEADVMKEARKKWQASKKKWHDKTVLDLIQMLSENSNQQLAPLLAMDRNVGRKDPIKAVHAYRKMIVDRLAYGAAVYTEFLRRQVGWDFNNKKFFVFVSDPAYITAPQEKASAPTPAPQKSK